MRQVLDWMRTLSVVGLVGAAVALPAGATPAPAEEPDDDPGLGTVIVGTPDHVEDVPRWVEPRPAGALELHAWAEAGYAVPVSGEAEAQGAFLSLARLQGRLHEDDFDAFLQVGADHGELALLDARIAWRPHERLLVRAGRFKSPVSAEYLIPAQRLLFTHRSLHMAIVPRRNLGAEAELHVGPEHADLALSAGVFDPASYRMLPGSGELATARALLHTASGFGAHVAGARWLRRDDALEVMGDEALSYDEHLVGALLFEEHGITTVVEGALARTVGRDAPAAAAGGVVSTAYRFPTGLGELDIEPAVALEVLVAEERTTCGQVAVNFHPHDWNLTQTVEWEVRPDEVQGPSHALYVQLQAGL